MGKNEILRFLKGQIKKHDNNFAVVIKYMTAAGKISKRHGEFVELQDDNELRLYNREKGTHGVYELDRITEIKKR